MHELEEKKISRRGFIRTAGIACVGLTGLTGLVRAEEAAAPAAAAPAAPAAPAAGIAPAGPSVEQLIAEKMGAGEVALEKVVMDAPDTAENAALVRIPVKVDLPMDAGNAVESVGIFVDNNPNPFIAKFNYLPEAGGPIAFEVRIKMGKASKVRIIAKNSGGKLFGMVKEIKVAEGGCAG